MIELKHPGLYIANGPKTCVLIKVIGTYPLLEIISGVDLNTMHSSGKVIALKPSDEIIMDIRTNARAYTFALPATIDSVNNELGLEKETVKLPEINETNLLKYIITYKECIAMFNVKAPLRFNMKMVALGYTVAQANGILMEVRKQIALNR